MRLPRRLLILWPLYFAQGLPYGFQIIALPVLLREQGASLAEIGFASALSLPWMIKALWGPAVDRFGHSRIGRRKSWILPLQIALASTCGAAAVVPWGENLVRLAGMVFLMNLFTATMDVAVDALAVDLLEPHQLGYGNIAQVVGYKVGMLTSGGLLLSQVDRIQWTGLFLAMAVLVVLIFLATLLFRENQGGSDSTDSADERQRSGRQVPAFRDLLRTLWKALTLPGSAWLLIFIATYKTGESMADAMFKPFLYDQGFGSAEIGQWVGTYGLVFSIAGSVVGGILASKLDRLTAVGLTATLRATAVAAEWWLTTVAEPEAAQVIAITCFEQFSGGAITVAVFALMMAVVDRRVGASHYTLLATVDVFGKLGASSVSGLIAAQIGYSGLFALATFLSFAFLLLLLPLRRVIGGLTRRNRESASALEAAAAAADSP
ncbi:MAG: MFS transporter [Acidobacteriota bacterium]